MNIRKIIILSLTAFACLIAGIALLRASENGKAKPIAAIKPPTVRCIKLASLSYPVVESFYGTLEPNIRVDMAFQVAGRIATLGHQTTQTLQPGDIIRTGQALATVESQRYEAAVVQANAMTQQAKAAMVEASANIAEASAKFKDAEQNLERIHLLKRSDAANKRDVERTEIAHQQASATLQAATARYDAAEAAYNAALPNETLAQVDLDDTTLRAPMDGLVASVTAEVGQIVKAGQPVVSLVDLSKVKLVIGVVERKLPLLKVGQKAAVDVLALKVQADLLRGSQVLAGPRHGKISVIPPAADPKDNLFKVQLIFDNADGLLRPGMVARADVTILERQAVAIPADATVRSGDTAVAFFIDRQLPIDLNFEPLASGRIDIPTNVARRVELKSVVFDKDHYLLLDMPNDYDQLIVEGFTQLTDGQRVRVLGDSIVTHTANAVGPVP